MSHAFGAPFVYESNGEKISFPLFSAQEYEALVNTCRASFRARNRQLADENGLIGAERAKFLADTDPVTIGAPQVELFVSDDKEARKVLAQALAKSGLPAADADAAIGKLTPHDRTWVARVVAGLIVLKPVEGNGDSKSPDAG